MAKGDVYPSESVTTIDPQSGATIRQVTRHESIHHHPFYYITAYDDAMQWLFFVSHRTGTPQIFAECRETGELHQLTDHDALNEWSLHPSHDGRHVYFTSPSGGWRVETETCREEKVVNFDGLEKAKGMVGAGMGTTTLSHNDRWWAIPVRVGNVARMLVVDTKTGVVETVCENESIGHPQFHPGHENLLRYGGPYDNRIWMTHRDGSNHRLVYQRNVARKEWIVHECWRPQSREILTTNWPHGVMAIDIDTGMHRWIARFNAWHPMIDPAGSRMVADTTNPDIGLQIFELGDEPAETKLLCLSAASNQGAHWKTDHCPYDDGPVEVYAPQHTHPHPNFSPDGRFVLFTSDRYGFSQLFEVTAQLG